MFVMAYRLLKCKKPHTIVEVVLSAAVVLVNKSGSESAIKLVSKVPLSNNISFKIIWPKTSINWKKNQAKGIWIAPHLICYLRFIKANDIVEECILCKCKSLDRTNCVGVLCTHCRAHTRKRQSL